MSERVDHKNCRWCGKPIVILLTTNGRQIAINPQPVGFSAFRFRPYERGDIYYQPGEHQPHARYCLKPDNKRKDHGDEEKNRNQSRGTGGRQSP